MKIIRKKSLLFLGIICLYTHIKSSDLMTAVKNNEGRKSPNSSFMEQLEKAKNNRTINQYSIEKQTPLMIAAQNGLITITYLLIKAGANPFIQDAKGHNSFWYAQNSKKDFNTIQNIVIFLNSSKKQPL